MHYQATLLKTIMPPVATDVSAAARGSVFVSVTLVHSAKVVGRNFTKLSALVHFGTRMKASTFGVKRSKFSVTVGCSVLEKCTFWLC